MSSTARGGGGEYVPAFSVSDICTHVPEAVPQMESADSAYIVQTDVSGLSHQLHVGVQVDSWADNR